MRICFVALALIAARAAAAIDVIDDRGVQVHLDRHASRIVTLAPNLAEIAFAAGTQIAAERSAREFETRLALRSHPIGQRLRVFYEIWHTPIMTVNGRHVISEMLSRCGAANILSDSPLFAGSVSLEQIYARNPDAILVAGIPQEEQLAVWRARTGLRAVRDGRVAGVDPATLHRMGPRVLEGLEHLCSRIDGFRR